jgi:hypothetical protein
MAVLKIVIGEKAVGLLQHNTVRDLNAIPLEMQAEGVEKIQGFRK